MYKYSNKNAATYAELGIEGTTYEPCFHELEKMLGSLEGKSVIDFGCGTGRSTRFLKRLNPKSIIGLDHNQEMVDQSQAISHENIEYQVIDDAIPLSDNAVDVVVSTFAFVEINSLEKMLIAAKEIYRVLKPGGTFIMTTGNPLTFLQGAEYRDFSYPQNPHLKSGMKTPCTVKGEHPFVIDDIYWAEEDYEQVLNDAGFKIVEKSFPKAEGDGWLDEVKITPHLVYKCIKSK